MVGVATPLLVGIIAGVRAMIRWYLGCRREKFYRRIFDTFYDRPVEMRTFMAAIPRTAINISDMIDAPLEKVKRALYELEKAERVHRIAGIQEIWLPGPIPPPAPVMSPSRWG